MEKNKREENYQREKYNQKEKFDQKEEQVFEYLYSAKQKAEIESIKKKYLPSEDKLEELKKLDRSMERKGTTTALVLGIAGTLLLGIGMSLTMVFAESYFVAGILIGICGIGLITAAYPVYRYTAKKQKEKVAPRILELSEELLK